MLRGSDYTGLWEIHPPKLCLGMSVGGNQKPENSNLAEDAYPHIISLISKDRTPPVCIIPKISQW